MALAKLRGKGQITIPAPIREDLQLRENTVLTVNKIGEAIILTQKPSTFEKIADEFSSAAKTKGITLDDLLKDLKKLRKK